MKNSCLNLRKFPVTSGTEFSVISGMEDNPNPESPELSAEWFAFRKFTTSGISGIFPKKFLYHFNFRNSWLNGKRLWFRKSRDGLEEANPSTHIFLTWAAYTALRTFSQTNTHAMHLIISARELGTFFLNSSRGITLGKRFLMWD